MNVDILSIKKLSKLSLLRNLSFVALAVILVALYLFPFDVVTNFFMILLLVMIYAMLSAQYLQQQKRLWEHLPRFRFMSWYFISFSIIWIVVLLVLAVFSYSVFENIPLTLAAGSIGIIEVLALFWIYSYRLHFIAVKPNHIMIIKKKMVYIFPESIAEIHYRNDILIFRLKNEATVFVNFLEVQDAEKIKLQIAKWLTDQHLNVDTIIEALKEKHKP